MSLRAFGICALLAMARGAVPVPLPQAAGPVDALVSAFEQAVQRGDAAALRALTDPRVPAAIVREITDTPTVAGASRVTIRERDRAAIGSDRVRLLFEILAERGEEGRVSTWRVDAASAAGTAGWRIDDIERLTAVSGLYRLALDRTHEYDVRTVTIRAPDLSLSIRAGRAFVARASDGITAVVVLGRGQTDFSPAPDAERGQLRIFCGSDALRVDFDALFVRVSPADFDRTFSGQPLTPRDVDPGDLRRASQIFQTYLSKSFQIDLGDLSAAQWSLIPDSGDFIAEFETHRYGTLTYARSTADPEDISLFDRRRRRNISLYASQARLAARGRFYSEDDQVPYDVEHEDVDVSFAPDRAWIEGRTHLQIHIRSEAVSTLTLHLADTLTVKSVVSPQFGRLLLLKVIGQNEVILGLPGLVAGGTTFDVTIAYAGRLPPQPIDAEAASPQQSDQEPQQQGDTIEMPPEPYYLYSNRSYWYPQSVVTDYATARLRVTIPADLEVVASGIATGAPEMMPAEPGGRPRKRVEFDAPAPVRYLACVISRFVPGPAAGGAVKAPAAPALRIVASPKTAYLARDELEKAADVVNFYGSIMRQAPYADLTIALAESTLPGGHSPAYFSLLDEPLATSPVTWTNDPVAFGAFPSFFIAHEVAHQWWGDGVGWKNYHEQWLSEGFAQYFAAMYAEHTRGPALFADLLRQMRRWAIDASPQGPVYLGYRIGHIKGNSRMFRAIVYDKGAIVLHMLRRLLGDDAFFAGLREFYQTWQYKKAGTDDLRVAMEHASGRPLARFFDDWIYGSTIPRAHVTSTVDSAAHVLRVRVDQLNAQPFDFPVTVTITYADGQTEDVFVAVADKTTTRTIPLRGRVRSIDVNRDGGTLANIVR
ncbi:MAG: M1 family metallopeptidase [Vicinamibacterales bacterium]